LQEHTPYALKSARKLRRAMTLPEVLLWKLLKGQPMGVKFHKQHPIDIYVLDFFCAEKRIAIEVDGIAHDMGDRPERDALRDAKLRTFGIEVIRLSAADVLRDVEGAADGIIRLCADRPPPSALRAATSPSGGGFTGVIQ
jgi:very-short-patch-repair endonuclease